MKMIRTREAGLEINNEFKITVFVKSNKIDGK